MNFFKKILVGIVSFFFPCKIYNKENIPEGGTLFVYNHLSALDPFFIMKAYNTDINFIAKKELFEKKLSAKILSSFGAIPIDRSNPDLKTLYTVFKKLRAGHKITISPEGTRNKTGSIDFLPFKPGAALFGVKGKCALIPAIVDRKAKIFRRTSIMFGKPFYLNEFENREFNDQTVLEVNKIIKEKMKETQTQLLNTVSKKRK